MVTWGLEVGEQGREGVGSRGRSHTTCWMHSSQGEEAGGVSEAPSPPSFTLPRTPATGVFSGPHCAEI